jgi:hypothetical protein
MSHSKKDPLDQKIDKLLASQPVKASDDFAARTLTEAEAQTQAEKPGGLAPVIRFALPMAAAIALAFAIFNQSSRNGTEASPQVTANGTGIDEELNSYEVQEIFMLQEGLSGFAQVESDELSSDDLFDTLETLYSI